MLGRVGAAWAKSSESLRKLATCRICRRITIAVVLAIVVVEFIILIPSAYRFQNEGFQRAEIAAQAAFWAAVDASRPTPEGPPNVEKIVSAAGRAYMHTPLVGGEVLLADGGTLLFGSTAERARTAYDAVLTRTWGPAEGYPYDVVALIDVSQVNRDLLAFIGRIALIVVGISLSVAAAVLGAIHFLFLRRVLSLQLRLKNAAEDPAHPERYVAIAPGDDEVDDLARSANSLLERSADQIRAFEHFNAELEERVEERTSALQATTKRMEAQIAVREAAEERTFELAAFVAENPEPALRIGPDDLVVYGNPAARRILAALNAEVGRTAPPGWADAMHAARSGGDAPMMREQEGDRTFNLRFSPAREEGTVNVYGRDVTVEVRAQANAVRAATHDPLTDLPNRSMFMTQLQSLLAQTGRSRGGVAVLTIGLKGFADVNERIGFDGGDVALKALARRLREVAHAEDGVARVGGDEFAIVAAGVPHVDAAAGVVARLGAAFDEPFAVDGQSIALAAAIGVSFHAADQVVNAELALRQSGQAMFRAKDGVTTTSAFFDASLDAEANEARRISDLIREAVDCNGFVLRYQPKISVVDGRLMGAEALIRLTHDGGAPVGPDRFIPIAERTGLIGPIGRWALFEGAETFARAHRDFGLRTPVSVNLSPRQLAQDDIPDLVAEALTETGLPPEMLELEITETAVVQDMDYAVEALTAITSRGVTISIDDFGTGQSSLAQLRRLPAAKVKLDRSFVTDIETDRNANAIARAVVGLANGLGKTTIAEGVETLGQFAQLRAMGIDEAQGYLFARPVEQDDFFNRARAADPYLGVAVAA